MMERHYKGQRSTLHTSVTHFLVATHQLEKRCFRATAAAGVVFIHHGLLWHYKSNTDCSDCNQCLFVRLNELLFSVNVVNSDPVKVSEKLRTAVIVGGRGINASRCAWTMSDPLIRGALSKSSQRGIFLCFCIQATYPPQTLASSGVSVSSIVLFVCFFYFVSMHRRVNHLFPVYSAENVECWKRNKSMIFTDAESESWGKKQRKLIPIFCLLFQNMDKTQLPSVTLIVGCGVSSLTLLLLIIIYVSVWR